MTIKQLSEFYGVPVKMYRSGNLGGYFSLRNGEPTIFINRKFGNLYSTFFHELGHVYCYEKGLWKAYHAPVKVRNGKMHIPKNLARMKVKTALKAERWVDSWARKEMAFWLPTKPYRTGYDSEDAKEWLENHLLAFYRKFM